MENVSKKFCENSRIFFVHCTVVKLFLLSNIREITYLIVQLENCSQESSDHCMGFHFQTFLPEIDSCQHNYLPDSKFELLVEAL